MSAQEIEKGGAAIAQSIVDDGKRVGIFEWFGSCTDSAWGLVWVTATASSRRQAG